MQDHPPQVSQLLNILKGNMSLAGPRPILLEQELLESGEIDVYRSVHPGLLGFWHVSDRNHISFRQRIIYDVYYMSNWQVWLDVYVLLHTMWVVLRRDGAY